MTKRPVAIEIEVQTKAGIPVAFNLHNRWYSVQNVLMHWVEVGPWWRSSVTGNTTFADVDDVTWRIWRIEAVSISGAIVADIAYRESLTSSSAFPWRLIRIFD
ncbi:MAG: hypothetical protein RL038_1143 [Actinomycetota bacterium]